MLSEAHGGVPANHFRRENKTRELISAVHKAMASCDAIQEREVKNDKAYAELEKNCNEALQDLDKNPLVFDMRSKIETMQGQVNGLHNEYIRLMLEERKLANYEQTLPTLHARVKDLESEREKLKISEAQLLQEIDGLKQDKAAVVMKVVLDAAIKLIQSDEVGTLVAKLVKASMFHGKCATFKEVANLKERFVLEKMPGYRPSSKEEFDRAGDDLANASYPFLVELIMDHYASLEQLLSKKPQSLHSNPTLSHSKPLSLKALGLRPALSFVYKVASHGQNPPPAYQAPAYQASGYQAPVHQPSIPQPLIAELLIMKSRRIWYWRFLVRLRSTNWSNNGLRIWYRSFNLDNQRLDVFGAFIISRRHHVLCRLGITFYYLRKRRRKGIRNRGSLICSSTSSGDTLLWVSNGVTWESSRTQR
nr:hypothetical protein [Tanacetum cinerariifolium]